MIRASNSRELQLLLRGRSIASERKDRVEFGTIRSFAYSRLFASEVVSSSPIAFRRASDPPDYTIEAESWTLGIEVSTITTPRFEIHTKERSGPGMYTSTLRSGSPNKEFWQQLREHSLPDDSLVRPHTETKYALDHDYFDVAFGIIGRKLADLPSYQAKFTRNLLLLHDRLSQFDSDFERRVPRLISWLKSQDTVKNFESIVLVDGNCYDGCKAYYLKPA